MGILRKEQRNFRCVIKAFEKALLYAGSDWPYREFVKGNLQECQDPSYLNKN